MMRRGVRRGRCGCLRRSGGCWTTGGCVVRVRLAGLRGGRSTGGCASGRAVKRRAGAQRLDDLSKKGTALTKLLQHVGVGTGMSESDREGVDILNRGDRVLK